MGSWWHADIVSRGSLFEEGVLRKISAIGLARRKLNKVIYDSEVRTAMTEMLHSDYISEIEEELLSMLTLETLEKKVGGFEIDRLAELIEVLKPVKSSKNFFYHDLVKFKNQYLSDEKAWEQFIDNPIYEKYKEHRKGLLEKLSKALKKGDISSILKALPYTPPSKENFLLSLVGFG